MKRLRWLSLAGFAFVFACQPQQPSRIVILDGKQIRVLTTNERVPKEIMAQAGVILGPADNVFYNGVVIGIKQALQGAPSTTLQIQRALPVTVNNRPLQTTASTVGEALSQAGMQLYAADRVDPPPAGTPITGPMAINYAPSQEFTVNVDGKQLHIRSSAGTVGSALAQAGIPLIGLDSSQPSENQTLPQDGSIRVVRIDESVILEQKAIPYTSQSQDSPKIQIGQEEILQPGMDGLAIIRTRVRYEDGQEVARQTEAEVTVRPPQNRIVARGTKIALTTITVDGVTIQYWRALQMFATVYTSSATKSGLPAGKGVVAVDPALYSYLNGQRIYVPGYGYAVIGDIGGGYIVEQKLGISRYRWIDLGFDENNLVDMTGWVTVYFLPPAPASIPDALK